MRRCFLALLLLTYVASAQPTASLFSRVEPILGRECRGCHGEGQVLSGLDLRTREGLLKGGTRGPAVIPGNAAKSLLYQALEGNTPLQMPPGGAARKLSAESLAAVAARINPGAEWAV